MSDRRPVLEWREDSGSWLANAGRLLYLAAQPDGWWLVRDDSGSRIVRGHETADPTLTGAQLAAESAAISLLVEALAAFPCEAPRGMEVDVDRGENVEICVNGMWCLPDEATTLARSLLCAAVRAGKESER